jgi:hypothetical protein
LADYGWNLSDLDNFMKVYLTNRKIDQYTHNVPLLEALKGSLVTDGFVGKKHELLMKTTRGFTGQAHQENQAVQVPKTPDFDPYYITLRELMTVAGLTDQMLDRATGGAGAWGVATGEALVECEQDMDWMLEQTLLGDGTGVLARVSTGTDNTGGSWTLTCDNTYNEIGCWENTQMIKVGENVSVYQADGTTVACSDGVVTAVAPGYRTAAGSWAAPTGTVTISGTESAGTLETDGYFIRKRVPGYTDATYVPVGAYPMGLSGVVQAYTGNTLSAPITTFQGIVRAAGYPSLNSLVLRAADFTPSGDSDGTPTDWDLSVVDDVITQINMSTKQKVDLIVCHNFIAQAIGRKQKSEWGSSIILQNGPNGQGQTASAVRMAKQFETSDGRLIPIVPVGNMSRHSMFLLTKDNLRLYNLGGFKYKQYSAGGPWMKSPADRKTNVEAWYHGYTQLGAERCDGCARIDDLRYDV